MPERPRIITPADVLTEQLEARGFESSERAAERRNAYLKEWFRLQRLVAGSFCGMTGRPAEYRVSSVVTVIENVPPTAFPRRLAGVEQAIELRLWVKWLMDVLDLAHTWSPAGERVPVPLAEVKGQMPPPPTRPFWAPQIWPSLGRGPDPSKSKRRGRARRS